MLPVLLFGLLWEEDMFDETVLDHIINQLGEDFHSDTNDEEESDEEMEASADEAGEADAANDLQADEVLSDTSDDDANDEIESNDEEEPQVDGNPYVFQVQGNLLTRGPLHSPACNNSEHDLRRMRSIIINSHDRMPHTALNRALWGAVLSCHDKCVDFLLSKGADWRLTTLLEEVTYKANCEAFKFLLQYESPTQDQVNTHVLVQMVTDFDNTKREITFLETVANCGFDTTSFLIPELIADGEHSYIYYSFGFILLTKQLKTVLLNGFTPNCIIHLEEEEESFSYLSQLGKFIMGTDYTENAYDFFQEIVINSLYVMQCCGENFKDGPALVFELNACVGDYKPDDAGERKDHMLEYFIQVRKGVEERLKTPLSLQNQCRLSLLKHLGRNYLKTVEELEDKLPNVIVKFLQGSDMD